MSQNVEMKYNIYPLSILSITDHYTRVLRNEESRMNEKVLKDKNIKVFGCIFGRVENNTVDIHMSLEGCSVTADYITEFIKKRTEDYNKIFTEFECLGLYFTGNDGEVDIFEARTFDKINNELFLGKLNYILKYNPIENDVYIDNIRKLPMTLYQKLPGQEVIILQCPLCVAFSPTEKIVVSEVIKIDCDGVTAWNEDRIRNLIAYKNCLLKQGCRFKNEDNKRNNSITNMDQNSLVKKNDLSKEEILLNEIHELSESFTGKMSREAVEESIEAIKEAEISLLFTKIIEGAESLCDFNSLVKSIFTSNNVKGLNCVPERNCF
uniref:COP9 signalosome complex subunit 6 n=1 Tax=Strongyloides papillosus TaxID=174720 RepID=A0A0N5BFD4_STREA